ncbi:hypothetical protein OG921_26270 [Aldersonia sp. NBC_00410]|uniref:hypothetical protein n=1 Tax=Aldersonia sp. NBC_00410 TaxID=2975954 RepID=UPI00225A43EE|nr:hypothetical protein [Aldersonia sp. NBC_00410]MCX5046685.1 hypothetical protein [Aldersonia sp. NBC_00410]
MTHSVAVAGWRGGRVARTVSLAVCVCVLSAASAALDAWTGSPVWLSEAVDGTYSRLLRRLREPSRARAAVPPAVLSLTGERAS